MTLDARLACVANQIRSGSRVADIGTDHAHLPVWLVRQGHSPHAIASDLREGPAQAARRTVAAAGLETRVDVRVGDGLSVLTEEEADDIVIAGMGGEAIAAILDACSWARSPALRWILQPMTRPEMLRRYLLTHGFSLLREPVVRDGRRLYSVMVAAYTGASVITDELAYWVGAIDPADEAAGVYLRRCAARLRQRAAGQRAAYRHAAADNGNAAVQKDGVCIQAESCEALAARIQELVVVNISKS